MTNMEYILNNLSDRDLALIFASSYITKGVFGDKVIRAFHRWSESFTKNKGNYAWDDEKNERRTGDRLPSIWNWEVWHYPNDVRKYEGRTRSVSFQVWLNHQYNPTEWED